ncbi:hypothetical protein VQ044_15160 [Aurantimonas sp. C2-5-R2]|uniref:hypothetical protein n=1 Tax=Aurantimonas sp. C2-5-R2 TaxID=3113713 RepID=UPI002F928CFF
MTFQIKDFARRADDQARIARLEIVDYEIDDAMLVYTAREIAAPYQEFEGTFVLEDEDPRVEELGCYEFWRLCRAIGLEDFPTETRDILLRDFAAVVSAGQIVKFLDLPPAAGDQRHGVGMGAATARHVGPDPMLDLIVRFRAAEAAYDAAPAGLSDEECDDLREQTCGPLYCELCDSPPPIRSNEGAIEAIRTAIAMESEQIDLAMLGAVINYLQASQPPT